MISTLRYLRWNRSIKYSFTVSVSTAKTTSLLPNEDDIVVEAVRIKPSIGGSVTNKQSADEDERKREDLHRELEIMILQKGMNIWAITDYILEREKQQSTREDALLLGQIKPSEDDASSIPVSSEAALREKIWGYLPKCPYSPDSCSLQSPCDICKRPIDGIIKLISEYCVERKKVKAPEAVTRFEVIDSTGRAYVGHGIKIEFSYQDEGRTLKVFVDERTS